ncbi:MAG: zonular occludens toxin domain-containing protein [Candidatus Electrothrix scaldis]|nr:MAG: zonular occludens toxin domain-containing protein [Candidatus Electrothrix sp. GW3-3]
MSVELLWSYTGGGKSMYAMTRAQEHLFEGGIVGLNFHLEEDWAFIMALSHPDVIKGTLDYEDCVKSLLDRCFYIGQVHTCYELAEKYKDRCVGYAAKRFERKILIVIDEAGLYLNTRDYRKNFPWVEFFTQHRKLGLDIILIAHHIRFIDNQAQHLISYTTRVVNLHEELRIPGTRVRWPWVFFIYVSRPRTGGRSHISFSRFSWSIAELYDTFAVFAFDKLSGILETQGSFYKSTLKVYEKNIPKAESPFAVKQGKRDWLDFLTDKKTQQTDTADPACCGGLCPADVAA